MLSYSEAKKQGLKPGMTFTTPKGVRAKVLNVRKGGKMVMELTCSEKGCKRTHRRLSSDVFQCAMCLYHAGKGAN